MSPKLDGKLATCLHLVSDKRGGRLDKFLAGRFPYLSRSYLQKLIADGFVAVNGRAPRASLDIKEGDGIAITLPPTPGLEPQPIPLNIAYEDEEMLVVDKPAGLPTHPGSGRRDHTLVNAILAYCPSLQGVGEAGRPGIVHRLDKDTSGLVMVAKTEKALRTLSGQFKSRSVAKRYLVLVKGRVEPKEGVIEAPIGRSPRHRTKMAVVSGGREAITRYKVLRYLGECTLLEIAPETGRTHQIRVHLAAIGHPVVGDPSYGTKHPGLDRQFLHACFLGFKLPRSGLYIELQSELPPDLQSALKVLSPAELNPSDWLSSRVGRAR